MEEHSGRRPGGRNEAAAITKARGNPRMHFFQPSSSQTPSEASLSICRPKALVIPFDLLRTSYITVLSPCVEGASGYAIK